MIVEFYHVSPVLFPFCFCFFGRFLHLGKRRAEGARENLIASPVLPFKLMPCGFTTDLLQGGSEKYDFWFQPVNLPDVNGQSGRDAY